MSIVLVHGNSETAVTWDELRGCLERKDVVALAPPGFGAAVAAGFGATSDDYVAWLAPALATIPQPIGARRRGAQKRGEEFLGSAPRSKAPIDVSADRLVTKRNCGHGGRYEIRRTACARICKLRVAAERSQSCATNLLH
jgi:hypothetical protein